jgi:2-polyprenyl-3-methyl-5-hydroxy-6-metoxy-1,4-benzoquinol methylase
LRRWWRFNRLYFANPPWDTGIVPPELKEVIEGAGALPCGKALDLGCGTGTNVIYLAQQGWQAYGVDYVPQAIYRAKRKAVKAQVAAHFYWSSVTNLTNLNTKFDLLVDMGCLHGLEASARLLYRAELMRLSQPGTIYLLYAHQPVQRYGTTIGISREEIETLFEPGFKIERFEAGTDSTSGRISAWYTLHRS